MQLFQNAQRGIPTFFHKKLLRQRLTQRLRKLRWKRIESDQEVCRVCVSDHRSDESGLADLRDKWSGSAKIDSTNFHVSHVNPTRSR